MSIPARGAPPEPQDTPAPPPDRHRSAAGRRERPRGARGSRGAPGPPALVRAAGPLVLLLTVLPAAALALRALRGDLGTDPVETLEHATGIWALRFLALALLVTPLQRLLGWSWLVRRRRALGVAAFAYATLHLLIYLVIDQGLDLPFIVEDVAERPWVTIGMATWVLLLPLAVTSTNGWVRRLGARRWRRLHQLAYLCGVTGTVHYFLAVKRDVTLPLVYAAIFAALLGWRLWRWWTRRRAAAPVADAA